MPDFDLDIPIYTTIDSGQAKIAGVITDGFSDIEITKTAGAAAGTFTATVQNINGVNNDTFNINDDVEFYLPDENNVAQLVFKGFIDSIDNSQFGKIVLSGQDYMAKLQRVVMNEVFSNTEASAIITNSSTGVNFYVNTFGITTNNVQTTTFTFDAYKISQKTAWDVMTDLANTANYAFYVDVDKDLHFEPQNHSSSGKTLTMADNVIKYSFLNDYKQSYNKVTVYGAQTFVKGQTSGANYPTESFNGDGSTKTFQLLHTAQAPLLEVKVGGVTKVEGTDFSVNYALAQVTFVTAPGVGTGNVTVTYDYVQVVLASATDATSVTANGLSEKVYNDRDITTTDRARIAANAYLTLYTDPKAVLNVTTRGHVASTVNPANSVLVNISRAGIVDATYNVASLKLKWGKGGYTADWTLATIDISLAEVLKELKTDIVELKRRGLTEITTTEQLVQMVLQQSTITVTVTSRLINTAFIFSVSVCGQHGAVLGDKRTYTFA